MDGQEIISLGDEIFHILNKIFRVFYSSYSVSFIIKFLPLGQMRNKHQNSRQMASGKKKCKHLSAEGWSEKTGRKTVADVYRILAQFSSREVFDKDFFSSHIHLLFCYFLQVLFAQMHFLRGYIFNLKLRAILMTFAKQLNASQISQSS